MHRSKGVPVDVQPRGVPALATAVSRQSGPSRRRLGVSMHPEPRWPGGAAGPEGQCRRETGSATAGAGQPRRHVAREGATAVMGCACKGPHAVLAVLAGAAAAVCSRAGGALWCALTVLRADTGWQGALKCQCSLQREQTQGMPRPDCTFCMFARMQPGAGQSSGAARAGQTATQPRVSCLCIAPVL